MSGTVEGRPIAGPYSANGANAATSESSAEMSYCSISVRICASMRAALYRTPFDGPVAPDVNTTAASASGSTTGKVTLGASCSDARSCSTPSKRRATRLVGSTAMRRPGQRSVLAAASARRIPIRWSGSATFIAALIWAGPSPPSISTGTAPIRQQPYRAMARSTPGGIIRATRSPTFTPPVLKRPSAVRCTTSSSSPNVTVRPSAPISRTATRSVIAGSRNAALKSTGAEGGGDVSPSAPSVSSQSTTIEARSMSSETRCPAFGWRCTSAWGSRASRSCR